MKEKKLLTTAAFLTSIIFLRWIFDVHRCSIPLECLDQLKLPSDAKII